MSDGVDEEYSVEKIVNHRIVDGKTFFLVRWEGYAPEDDTWEPYENVKGCTEALDDYRSGIPRVAKNLEPINVASPDKADSSDYDVFDADDAKKETQSEDDRPGTSSAKPVKTTQKYRRISRVITSSSSDEDVQGSSVSMKEQSAEMKKKTKSERKSKAEKPLPVKISNSQQLGKQESHAAKTAVVQQTKRSEKKKKSTDETGVVRPTHFVPDALKPKKKKKDKPNAKYSQKPEMSRHFESGDDSLDRDAATQKMKTKSVHKPERISSVKEDPRPVDIPSHKSEPKSAQKPESAAVVHPDRSLMDQDVAIGKPKKKSAGMPERASRVEELSSMFCDLETSGPKKKPDVADSRSSSPTEMVKNFHIPKTVPAAASGDGKKKKPAMKRKLFEASQQPKVDSKLPALKSSAKGGETRSESLSTASITGARQKTNLQNKSSKMASGSSGTASRGGAEQPKIPPKQRTSYDAGAGCSARTTTHSAPSKRDDAGEQLESNIDGDFADALNWSPKLEIDQSVSQIIEETSNSSTLDSLLTKSHDRPESMARQIALPLPPPPQRNVEMEMKMKALEKVKKSREVIDTMHNYAKRGNFAAIAKFYSAPGQHDWEMVNANGSTILMQAAVNGRADIVKLLLLNGADANARQSLGKTLLMLMCEGMCGPSNQQILLAIVEMLVCCGARMNLISPHGETALMMACRRGYSVIVKFLLELGADFYVRTMASPRTAGRRMSALDFAKIDPQNKPLNSKEHLEIVEMLSTLEARVNTAFDAQVKLVLGNFAKLLDPLFDTTIFSLFEDTKFMLSFDYKKQECEPDTGLLLFVAHMLISLDDEILCRINGNVSTVCTVKLNGVRLRGIMENDHVLSFYPVKEGTNDLKFETADLQNSDIKLVVRAYKVQLLPL